MDAARNRIIREWVESVILDLLKRHKIRCEGHCEPDVKHTPDMSLAEYVDAVTAHYYALYVSDLPAIVALAGEGGSEEDLDVALVTYVYGTFGKRFLGGIAHLGCSSDTNWYAAVGVMRMLDRLWQEDVRDAVDATYIAPRACVSIIAGYCGLPVFLGANGSGAKGC
jgi:hypothetical protein